jgi:hypothetical protein
MKEWIGAVVVSTASLTMNHEPSDRISSCIQRLKHHNIRVVSFDMDLTAVRQHSRGRLKRGAPLSGYLKQATPDFLELVPHLHDRGFQLSISTHSDEAEYNMVVRKETHILGDELATTLLTTHFEPAVASAFYVVAYNPRVRKENFPYKRFHMQRIMEHYEISDPAQIVFFDDDKGNVKDSNDTCGVKAILVDPKQGFRLDDLLKSLPSMDGADGVMDVRNS